LELAAKFPEEVRYGLAPTMNVSEKPFQLAEKMLLKADEDHNKFEDEHEENCKGMLCPTASKVDALMKSPK